MALIIGDKVYLKSNEDSPLMTVNKLTKVYVKDTSGNKVYDHTNTECVWFSSSNSLQTITVDEDTLIKMS